jgi:hypothetical protein
MLDGIKGYGLDVVCFVVEIDKHTIGGSSSGRLTRFSMLSCKSQQTSRSAVHVEVERICARLGRVWRPPVYPGFQIVSGLPGNCSDTSSRKSRGR